MQKFKTFIIVLLAFILMAIAGGAAVIYDRTLVSPGVIIGITVAVGILSAFLATFKSENNKIIRALIALACGSCISAAAILSLNYFCTDKQTIHTEKAEIVKKYTKQRDERRRSGRHYISTGRKHTVYYISLRFNVGKTKNMHVSASEFSRLRTGQQVSLTMATGLLGWPVYTDVNLSAERKKKVRKK